MPRVSAIIPTRNRPELVCKAVRSVLDQSISDVEAIVVIDGPDEASQRALEQIADPRLRVIALHESVGGSEARNTGVRAATSRWIALLDDDDQWLPNKLELQLPTAERSGSDSVVSVTRFLMRTDGSETIWPQRFPLPGEAISEYLFCTSRNVFQTSTVLCSRSLFLEMPFTKGLKRLQDWDWLLRVMQCPGVVLETTPEVLSIYVVHAVTVSNAADWRGGLVWAKENRGLFTPKAYSCFIAKKCAADARRQNASLKERLALFRESFKGSTTPRSVLMFLIYVTVLPENRQRIGDKLFRAVRSNTQTREVS